MARLVQVEWIDAFFFHDVEWLSEQEIRETDTGSIVYNTGYLVRSDPTCIILASSANLWNGRWEYRDLMTIPRSMVKKVLRA